MPPLKNLLGGALLLLLALQPARAATPAESCPLPENIYPADAYPLAVSGTETLQQALDAHGSVRLLPGVYGPVTIHSGQRIYGLPGVKVGPVTVEPGTTGALVAGIQGNVLFPASGVVTHGNTFVRIYGSFIVKGGTLENNLFVDSRGLDVDVSASGYLRNNRFVRAPGQMQGNSMIKFIASPDRPSTGNTFLWTNAGGNEGPTTNITGVPDLTIAVVDAEMWSFKMKVPTALFITGPMQRFDLFAVQGGRYDKDPAYRSASGLINSPAKEVRVFGLTCGYRGQTPDMLPAKIVLQDGNERSLFAGCLPYSYSLPASSVLSVRAFDQTKGVEGKQVKTDGISPVVFDPANAEQTQQAALRDMILQAGRTMVPWPRPVFGPLAPIDTCTEKTLAKDQTKMLQDRLDKEGMVVLPAGKFYISAPLSINSNRGIIGAGMDKTIICAMDPKMSMFIYDPAGKTRGATLENLTLEGGSVGVHIRGTETDHPLCYTCLTNITFRNLSEAGVFMDMPGPQTGSLDNNMISFCNFVHCGAGLKQNAVGQSGWGFIDKLVTYRCRFLDCGIGVDFPAARSNNLCTWIDCLFQGNTIAAAELRHNSSPVFANCDFVGNAGSPVVASDDFTYFLSCNFKAAAGSASLLPPRSIAEGCIFEQGDSTGCAVVGKPIENHFYNCQSEMPPGPLNTSLLLNNKFSDRDDLSQLAISLVNGKPFVIAGGTPKPGPQILVSGP